MTNGNPEPERQIQEKKAKKPYIKPAFRVEVVFVTTALSCGKVDRTQTLCGLNPKAS
jgi:hypothetical protein